MSGRGIGVTSKDMVLLKNTHPLDTTMGSPPTMVVFVASLVAHFVEKPANRNERRHRIDQARDKDYDKVHENGHTPHRCGFSAETNVQYTLASHS